LLKSWWLKRDIYVDRLRASFVDSWYGTSTSKKAYCQGGFTLHPPEHARLHSAYRWFFNTISRL